MRIAVVGKGFAGTAVLFYLADMYKDASFSWYSIPGSSASSAAAGLVHPYPGRYPRFSEQAFEAFSLLEKHLEKLSLEEEAQFYRYLPLLRLALDEKVDDFFRIKKDFFKDTIFMEGAFLKEKGKEALSGLLFPKIVFLDAPVYLETMERSIKRRIFVEEFEVEVKDLNELAAFDMVFLCLGAGLQKWNFGKDLSFVKGQRVDVSFEREEESFFKGHAFIGNSYSIPLGGEEYIFGSTYERGFVDEAPEYNSFVQDMVDKNALLLGKEGKPFIKKIYSGVRVSQKNHKPFYLSLGKGRWIFSGLGSKGLLYHMFYAEKLTTAVREFYAG